MANPYLTDYSAGLANEPQASTRAEAGAQAFSSAWAHWDAGQMQVGDPSPVVGPVRYLGHWPELLADLALLGRVWVESEQPGLRLAQRQQLSGLRVLGMLGYLDTPKYQVRVLLDRCHALSASDDEQGLVIEDAEGQRLMRVQLERGAHPLPLRLLLSGLGAHDRRLVPAPSEQVEPRVAALEHHPVHRLQRDCQALEAEPGCAELTFPGATRPELDFLDLAELSGRLSLNPLRWKRASARSDDPAIAVDPSLVPCALETLVDQVHPLVLSTGSDAWVSRSIQQFYGHAYVDGQLLLRGDHARLELDVRAIDSAWVVGDGRSEGRRQDWVGGDGRSLRLYDEDGRALAIIASAAEPDGETGGRWRRDEARLWTTLMNALTS
ncbi:hypothetical protein [Halochromatium sp.]